MKTKKKMGWFPLLLVLVIGIFVSGCSKSKLEDGIYTGTGSGYNDDITVAITVKEGSIYQLSIEEQNETEQYFAMAESLIGSIMSKGNTQGVDVVAGATGSSRGIIEAVEDALKDAYQ